MALVSKTGNGSARMRYELADWKGNVLDSDFAVGDTFGVELLPTSYGIQASTFQEGAYDSSILLLDYPAHWVQTNNWLWNSRTPPHNGKINVLFRNGSVEPRVPASVSPTGQPFVIVSSKTNGVYWGLPQ